MIKHFTGEFKCLSYIDEDGDKVCCYKEEEAKMAVFEDGITTFNIVLENKDVGPNTKGNHDIDSDVGLAAGANGHNEGAEFEIEEELRIKDQGTSNAGTISSIESVEDETDLPEELSIGSSKLKKLQELCVKYGEEHLSKYGISCILKTGNDTENLKVTCSKCNCTLNATNPRNIKSHIFKSQLHRANVYAICERDTSEATRDETEILMVVVKRYIHANALQEEIRLEEDNSKSDDGFITCLVCVPICSVNLTGRGSVTQRISAHLLSKGHQDAKINEGCHHFISQKVKSAKKAPLKYINERTNCLWNLA